MSSSLRAPALAALGLLLLGSCGGSSETLAPPTVTAVSPACGDASGTTALSIQGTFPVLPAIDLSDPSGGTLDTHYRAWVGEVELTGVTWTDATALTAVVPAGGTAGTYDLAVEGPTGGRATLAAAFQVRAGACPIQTAALTLAAPTAAPSTLVVGQDVTLTATVGNAGQAKALGVSAAVTSAPAGFTLTSGPVAPQDVPAGEQRTFSWTYQATAAVSGVFVVSAAGTAEDSGLAVSAPAVNSNAVLVNAGAFLTANTTVSATQVTVGQLVTVVLTATNHATAAATVTPAMVATGPATPGAAPAAQSIPAGASRAFQWTYTASAAGTATFTASVSGVNPSGGAVVTVPTAAQSVTVQAQPALAATLAVPATVDLGDFTVTMFVRNTGGAAAADVVQVVPDRPTVQGSSTATAVFKSGPTGSPATVSPGQADTAFTWTFTATGSGALLLGSTARGVDANTGTAVTSALIVSSPAQVAMRTIGGAVTGLLGGGLVLQSGSDRLSIAADGAFTFPTRVGAGRTYVVTVATQPSVPTQACTVANGTGTVGSADVTSVQVTCTTSTFTVGGTVTGYAGTGLVLSNGADSYTMPAGATTFTMPAPVASGATYAVTVATQPTSPAQTCTVSNGGGTVGGANVTGVAVTCSTRSFTVGGTVGGYDGTGLVLHNGADSYTVPAGASSFTMPASVASGATYAVTVATQPTGPSQTCTVTAGSGTVGSGNVTSVSVTCATRTFTVGGSITGYAGSGLVLQNGGSSFTVPAAATSFTMPAPVASGATYAITVATQPTGPSQTCTVASGSGTVGAANVTSVAVTCSVRSFTVGGTVSGLTGSGLVLRNGSEDLPVAASGAFTFATPVASGGSYAVTVATQPSSPSQTCTVSGGTGTVGGGNVTGVSVACTTRTFTVGGTVSGLAGSGLVLHNGSENLPVATNGAFTFATPVASGATYGVTVATQPSGPAQTCTVASGSGTVGAANVTGVTVTCSTSSFTVGGTVSGLTGSGLVLRNGSEDLPVAANGAFTFATPVASGGSYAVTVATQPSGPSQTCTVSGGTGTVGGGNVTGVSVACVTRTFTVGGTVSGLAGSGLVLHNGSENLPVATNGAFTFATPVASGASYAVTVATQPSGPAQTCTVASGSGTVGGANVTGVAVTCSTSSFTVGGTVSGYTGSGLVLHNGADSLTVPVGATTFTMPASVASGGAYAVTVATQPSSPTQTCTVSSGSGTMGSASVTSVSVTCTINFYTVGGTITGYAGTGLVLHNGASSYTVPAGATSFTLPGAVASGGTYAVTVTTQPSGPSQTCTIAGGSGTAVSSNVTSVSVTCSTRTFTVGGTVIGYAGSGLVLHNGSDDLPISANGTFTFPTQVASGATYAVTVANQPSGPSQACTVSNGIGTLGTGPVTSVNVNCSTSAFTVGGTITGYAGSGLVLQNGADTLTVPAGATTFIMPAAVASGAAYDVTVAAQPSAPAQTCTVSSGSGTVGGGDVTSVVVACSTSAFTVGGTISGYAGSGLVLQNGADTLTVPAGATTFTMPAPLQGGDPYAIVVTTQPTGPSQTCGVLGGSGTMGGGDVTTITVTCTTSTFGVGGTITGYLGSGLTLQNGADTFEVPAGATGFTMPVAVASGGSYAVTVTAQPGAPSQTCTVSGGSGTVGGGDVTTVAVDCTTDTFTVGGAVSGLITDGLVLKNGAESLPVLSGATAFTFTVPVESGGVYAVVVDAQPVGQLCAVTGGEDGLGGGTVAGAPVTSVQVTCTP